MLASHGNDEDDEDEDDEDDGDDGDDEDEEDDEDDNDDEDGDDDVGVAARVDDLIINMSTLWPRCQNFFSLCFYEST